MHPYFDNKHYRSQNLCLLFQHIPSISILTPSIKFGIVYSEAIYEIHVAQRSPITHIHIWLLLNWLKNKLNCFFISSLYVSVMVHASFFFKFASTSDIILRGPSQRISEILRPFCVGLIHARCVHLSGPHYLSFASIHF